MRVRFPLLALLNFINIMDIEKIKKLARLANNNPNENEANLAARKVCKLLVEADFKFVETVKTPPKQDNVERGTEYWYRPDWGEFKSSWFDEQHRRREEEEQAYQEEERKAKERRDKKSSNFKYGSWDKENFHRKYPRYEQPTWKERTKEKKEWKPVDDWILDPKTRVYKNRVTNVEIIEIEFVFRYGTHIEYDPEG